MHMHTGERGYAPHHTTAPQHIVLYCIIPHHTTPHHTTQKGMGSCKEGAESRKQARIGRTPKEMGSRTDTQGMVTVHAHMDREDARQDEGIG